MLKKLIPFTVLCIMAAGAPGQVQRLVLFEEFTGEDCPNCFTTNPYVQTLINQNPGKVTGISYQSFFPSPGSLYFQDVSDDRARVTYYGVTSAPWGQQDGLLWDTTAGNVNGNQPYGWAIAPAYLDTEYTRPSPFTINVTHLFTASTDSFYATVVITGADSFTAAGSGKLALRIAMVEDLVFPVPPGTNGETSFPNAVRHMYPDAAGTTLPNTWISGQAQTFSLSGLVPASIKDKTKVRFVAFVQDDNNRQVLQAGQSQPFTFTLDAKMQSAQGNFVHCTDSYTPAFTLLNNGSGVITSDSFQVSVDGSLVSSQRWTGNLAAGDSTTLTLSPVTLSEGVHKVVIISKTPNGLLDGNSGNDAVIAIAGVTNIIPDTTSIIEGFENFNTPGWLAESVSQFTYGWSRQAIGNNSSFSYQLDLWDIPVGYISNLYAPSFTLAGLTRAAVRFDRSYAPFDYGSHSSGLSGLSKDSLYIEVSTNCGNTWQTVYVNGDSAMATAPANDLGPFSPTAAQWVNDRADLTPFAGNTDVLLRFKGVSGNGNELYIDNINIFDPVATGVAAHYSANTLHLFPNPANEFITVSWELKSPSYAKYRVSNVVGQVVMEGTQPKIAGVNNWRIDTSLFPDGLYLLNIRAEDGDISRSFLIMH